MTTQSIGVRLRRAAFPAYRLLWCAAFAAVLVLTLIIGPRDEIATQAKYRAFMAIGVGAWWNPSARGQYGGPFGPAGYQAGFADGDLVTAIDGRALPQDAAGRVAMLNLPDGQRVAVTAQRPSGVIYTAHVVRSSRYEREAYAGWHISLIGRRWAVFAVNLAAYLVSLAAALILFVRRPRDPVAAILSLALLTAPLSSGNIATTITGLGGIIAAAVPLYAGTLAVLFFPDGRLTTRWHWLALALLLAGVPYGVVPSLIGDSTGLLPQLITYSAGLALIAAVWAQFKLTPSGTERQQIKFVLLGVVTGALLGIVATLLDSQLYHRMPEGQRAWLSLIKWTVIAFGNLAVPVGLLVSLTRYRLYDADSAISRSIAYGVITLGGLAIFAGSEKLIEILGEEYFGEHLGALAGGLGAAVAAVMIVPLHHRVTHWAEHRFRSALAHLRQGLPLLVGDMRETATPHALADAMLVRVQKGTHAAYGAVVMDNAVVCARDIDSDEVRTWIADWGPPAGLHDRLDCDRGDRLFPLRAPLHADGVGLVGWLLLGPRPDGSFYGKFERGALLEIAEPAARALAIAVTREGREMRHREEMDALRQIVSGIQKRLGPDLTAPVIEVRRPLPAG